MITAGSKISPMVCWDCKNYWKACCIKIKAGYNFKVKIKMKMYFLYSKPIFNLRGMKINAKSTSEARALLEKGSRRAYRLQYNITTFIFHLLCLHFPGYYWKTQTDIPGQVKKGTFGECRTVAGKQRTERHIPKSEREYRRRRENEMRRGIKSHWFYRMTNGPFSVIFSEANAFLCSTSLRHCVRNCVNYQLCKSISERIHEIE